MPPDAVPGQDAGVPSQIANSSMSYLAQSLAVSSARGNPDIGAFSGVMTALRKACGLMSEGFREACLDVEVMVQTTLVEATAHNRAFVAKAAKDLDLWTSALQPLFDADAVPEAKMEIRCAHARSTGQVVSDWILAQSREVAKDKFPNGGPVRMALLQFFAKVEERCMQTLKKVADQAPEIMAQHVPEGQVGVFLAALYQLICTQQQGITLMVVAQASVPIHLGVNNWATTASMTWLFAQVIPGLGSLHGCTAAPEQIEYMPIASKGCMVVPTLSFPGEQVWEEGTATHPIYLGNETDSGISSMGRSTPAKTLVKGSGSHHQPLTSTPKPKPKLLVAAQHWDELAAKQRRAPHGAHVWPTVQQAARTQPPGPELHSWMQSASPGRNGNSSFVSIEEHSEFTMAALMRRDAPHRVDPDEDIVSIRDSSDVEMVSTHEYDRETKKSSPDSGVEDSHHPSDGSDMESDQDRGSDHHSDLDSEQGSDLSSAPRSDASLGSDNSGDPESSDNGGDFSDMFMVKKECTGSSKKPQSQLSSNSCSRSQETENQKRRHIPSPENTSNSNKPDLRKKKSDQKETPSKTTPKKESAQDKATRRVGEEVVHKFREEGENRERESWPKKPKKKESSLWKETSAGRNSSKEDERHNQKKEKDAKAREAWEAECWAEERKKRESRGHVTGLRKVNQQRAEGEVLGRVPGTHPIPEG